MLGIWSWACGLCHLGSILDLGQPSGEVPKIPKTFLFPIIFLFMVVLPASNINGDKTGDVWKTPKAIEASKCRCAK